MKLNRKLIHSIGLALGISLASTAQADTVLSGYLAADNEFDAYISTDDSLLGTLIASSNDLFNAYHLDNVNLISGQNYFLHIIARNWEASGFNPDGFIGSFSLSNSEFQFANGNQTLATDVEHWRADPSGPFWTAPTGTPADIAVLGQGPWGYIVSNLTDSNAHWIWPTPDNGTAFLSTPISNVPTPSALWLFASGIAGCSILRKKKLG